MSHDTQPTHDLAVEFLPVFLDDTRDKLARLETLTERLLGDPGNAEVLYEILRIVHSLKGTAGTFNFPFISILAHKLEDYILQTGAFSERTVKDIYHYIKVIESIIRRGRNPDDAECAAISRNLPMALSIGDFAINQKLIEALFIGPRNIQFSMLELELKSCGIRVTNSSNSFLALEIAARTRPDLIMICNVVDSLSGVELAHMFRCMNTTKEIPLMFIKSELNDPAQRTALEQSLPAGVGIVRKGRFFSDDFAEVLIRLGVL